MPLTPYVTSNVVEMEEGSANSRDGFLSTSDSNQETNSDDDGDDKKSPGNRLHPVNDAYQRFRERQRNLSDSQRRKRKVWCVIFTFIVIVTSIGVLVSSMSRVDENDYGVQYNIHKKQLDDAIKSGGLFTGPPGFKFITFPSTFVTADFDNRTCVSRDGLRVSLSVTFQYQIIQDQLLPAILKYRNFFKWADVVEAAGLSAIHHTCAEFRISNFQNKRGEIQTRMEENLRLKLEGDEEAGREGVFARAISLQLRNLELPSEYSNAVEEKQSAEEDISLAKNQRLQETTKAQTELLAAQEEARKILDTARNEADVVLTEARLKAEETTFAFEKEAETIVDVRDSLELTTEGVLSYLATSMVSEAQNLHVTTGEPAVLSRAGDL